MFHVWYSWWDRHTRLFARLYDSCSCICLQLWPVKPIFLKWWNFATNSTPVYGLTFNQFSTTAISTKQFRSVFNCNFCLIFNKHNFQLLATCIFHSIASCNFRPIFNCNASPIFAQFSQWHSLIQYSFTTSTITDRKNFNVNSTRLY